MPEVKEALHIPLIQVNFGDLYDESLARGNAGRGL